MDTMAREGVLSSLPAIDEAEAGIDLEQLVREESDRLRGLAWRFGLPSAELDDAVQEVFARAWAGRARFRGDCAPATWLTRIAVNYFTSRRRTLLRRMRVFAGGRPAGDASAPPGNTAERAEAHARAVECIRALSPKLRKVFVLRYLEEMSCAEVAETLGIPESTVRTRVYNARKKLRNILKGHAL
ncbi:MAG: sigma-70 family RNA polymerase sigma factor [Candidatus Hydrogenedentes bacterium]|nr:sigma-70 family RNA polymerase sigma factor [Candidatus Hydrogenedentota bacterium]